MISVVSTSTKRCAVQAFFQRRERASDVRGHSSRERDMNIVRRRKGTCEMRKTFTNGANTMNSVSNEYLRASIADSRYDQVAVIGNSAFSRAKMRGVHRIAWIVTLSHTCDHSCHILPEYSETEAGLARAWTQPGRRRNHCTTCFCLLLNILRQLSRTECPEQGYYEMNHDTANEDWAGLAANQALVPRRPSVWGAASDGPLRPERDEGWDQDCRFVGLAIDLGSSRQSRWSFTE